MHILPKMLYYNYYILPGRRRGMIGSTGNKKPPHFCGGLPFCIRGGLCILVSTYLYFFQYCGFALQKVSDPVAHTGLFLVATPIWDGQIVFNRIQIFIKLKLNLHNEVWFGILQNLIFSGINWDNHTGF